MVYRAWAKVRAKQFRTWLMEHMELLVGHRQEAEFHAAALATTLSLGRATGEGAGVVLRKAGEAEQILRPAFSIYKGARAVRVGDAVGPCKEPDFGLPAGCPFSTFFLVVFT